LAALKSPARQGLLRPASASVSYPQQEVYVPEGAYSSEAI
jgi:hypothetical protein